MDKGFHHSEKTKNKIREARKRQVNTNKGQHWKIKNTSKMGAGNRGKKLTWITSEMRKKAGEMRRGRPSWNKGKKFPYKPKPWLKGKPPWNKGKPYYRIMGDKNGSWKGGITPINNKIRGSLEYTFWVREVFKRDNFTCQKYGIRGGKLTAHHINNFSEFPELRFAIDNGITFSKEAHKEFHKRYGRKNNTEGQLQEFLGRVKSKVL